MKAVVNFYEELADKSLQSDLDKARERLERLEVLSSASKYEDCSDPETDELDLSDLELSEDEQSDVLSSDSGAVFIGW